MLVGRPVPVEPPPPGFVVVAVPAPVPVPATAAVVRVVVRGLDRHDDRSALSWSSARFSDDSSNCSWVRARSVAERFAAFVASTCDSVAFWASRAWFRLACAAGTALPPCSFASVAACWSSVASLLRQGLAGDRVVDPGERLARRDPVTHLDQHLADRAAVGEAQALLARGRDVPDAFTASATVPRSTRTVGCPGLLFDMQLTATRVMATIRTSAMAASRITRRLRWRRVSGAGAATSWVMEPPRPGGGADRSLVAQGLDRAQPRGAVRGIAARDQPDQQADRQGEHDRARRDRRNREVRLNPRQRDAGGDREARPGRARP